MHLLWTVLGIRYIARRIAGARGAERQSADAGSDAAADVGMTQDEQAGTSRMGQR
jgi:hypothetical protein